MPPLLLCLTFAALPELAAAADEPVRDSRSPPQILLSPAQCQAWGTVANASGGLGAVCAACSRPGDGGDAPPSAAPPPVQASDCALRGLSVSGTDLQPPFDAAKRRYAATVHTSQPMLLAESGADCRLQVTCWDRLAPEAPPIPPALDTGVPRFALPLPGETASSACEVALLRGDAAAAVYTVLLGREPGVPLLDDPVADEEGAAAASSGGGGVMLLVLLCSVGGCCWAAQRFGVKERGAGLLASIEGGSSYEAAGSGALGF
uniref:Uncharacterized protein n=1 Tax=Emiliania huxleyi TaxID=2903 RepID=A0A6U8MJZ6_EMIHU